ncbi:CidA/LrgA family protein [Cohnella sp. LGH]|uniref:CidA/LrgA family protein n=1 Tax=Cohnella sp. LGH TaxID=1619153 RepID=UPI001ADB8EC2|nr:CidA/LrgA family protein [Cohnella sp. LGH]QTH41893.1 CidA/LrgA family protein [Cohnella sp. LGH]
MARRIFSEEMSRDCSPLSLFSLISAPSSLPVRCELWLHLPLPAIVRTIAFADMLKSHWAYVVAGVVPGTLLVMAVSGLVTKGLSRKGKDVHDSADLAG